MMRPATKTVLRIKPGAEALQMTLTTAMLNG